MSDFRDSRLIILVISSTQNHFLALEDAIKTTWGKNIPSGCCLLFLHGDLEKDTEVCGDQLTVCAPEGLENIGYKMIEAFRYLLKVNKSFSYIYRTNLSSFIWVPSLLDTINFSDNESRYSGVMGCHEGINFASGSGYLISRDLVEKVVINKDYWDHKYLDDVALGKVIGKLNVPITTYPRIDVPNMKALKKVKNANDNNNFHYRCKSDTGNRKFDIVAMNYLYRMFSREKKTIKINIDIIKKICRIK